MAKPKNLEQLRAEKEQVETQLAQEQHKLERLENRKKYLEKGERQKRTHRLCNLGGTIESLAPEFKDLTRTEMTELMEYIELDEHTRKCLAFEATLTDRQIDMLQELGYLPVIMRQYGEECANCPYTLDEREHGICRRCAVFKK